MCPLPQIVVLQIPAADLVSSLNSPKLVLLPFTADCIELPTVQPPFAGAAFGQFNTGQGGSPGAVPIYAVRLNAADNAEISLGVSGFCKFRGTFDKFYIRLLPGYATPSVPLYFFVSKNFDMQSTAEIHPSSSY